jgi:hypothetical protein
MLQALVESLNTSGMLASTRPVPDDGQSRLGVGLSGADDEEGTIKVFAEGIAHTDANFILAFAAALDNQTLVDQMAEIARRGGTPHPLVYDVVIRCLGWLHETGVYDEGTTQPWMQQNGKYPIMTPEYESANVPGLFFAGQLAHGKDFRRAAGGFIHGFRYTARALFRVLEHRYHGSTWPGGNFDNVQAWDGKGIGLGELGCNKGDWGMGQEGCQSPQVMDSSYERLVRCSVFDMTLHSMILLDRTIAGLKPSIHVIQSHAYQASCLTVTTINHVTTLKVDKIFSRINTASGIYQMVGVLGDGIVLQCPTGTQDTTGKTVMHAQYLEEVPLDYFNRRFDGLPRVFVQFGYGEQSQSLHKSRQKGTLFQVYGVRFGSAIVWASRMLLDPTSTGC